jgi:hypothetical protein
MNRALVIPAVGCVLVFAGTFAMLHRAAGETGPKADVAPPAVYERGREPETKLKTLAAEYVRPWQEYQRSPARLYSRVAPRPVPSIGAEVELVTTDAAPGGSVLLATIHVSIGDQKTSTPVIVDRDTKEVRVFSQGKWQNTYDWLKTAPNPRSYDAPTTLRGREMPVAVPAAPTAEPVQGAR